MPENHDAINDLIEAVSVSPENLPLRKMLAERLLRAGRAQEAEKHLLEAVRLSKGNADMKLALARAYRAQGKTSQAVVVLEELVQGPSPTPTADVLYARVLLDEDRYEKAGFYYRRAIEADASLADERLGELLDPEEDAESRNPFIDDEGRMLNLRDDAEFAELDLDIERPRIDFGDVGGMESVKDEIRMKIVHPLQHADLYQAYGKAVGGGILMYGPPGCGKTYLARATAGEVEADFLCVGLDEILDMYIGNSERKLHAVFEQARRNAPCVLFFDEVDALGAKRSDMRTSAGRMVINQFLSELDGAQHSNDGLLILAATNAPWHLDAALRRPGRFDRVIFVPPPDAPARAEILRLHLAGKPCQDDVDLQAIAAKTAGFSGADLKSLVDVAVEAKLAEAMRDGAPVPLSTRDLRKAARRVRAVSGEWFATARNYAMYANENGMYDDVLKYDGK
jgi:SpoVK/Ycf46/Vps4 family AAA+-type ATPase